MTRRYISSHTSLRGIAALLVVFYHLGFGAPFHFAWENATPFFRKGYLWVDLFFILSGFVIAYSMQMNERAPYGRAEMQSFWVARFARIYPLHLVCLLAMLFIKLALTALGSLSGKQLVAADQWGMASWLNFFEQLFLLNAWGLTGRVGWNIPSWSISGEMFAYFLFPALAALLIRGGRSANLALLFAIVAFYGWVGSTTGSLDIVKGLAILRCLAGFSLGMLLFLARDRFARLSDSKLGLLQAIALPLVLSPLIFGLNDVLAVPGFFLLVATSWTDRGWLARPLALRPLIWLGEISYSIYLVHVVLLTHWAGLTPPIFAKLGFSPQVIRVLVIATSIILVIGVATFTYHFVERPARTAIIRWFKTRRERINMSSLRAPDRLT